MKDEALKLALDALEAALSDDQPYIDKSKNAITAIKQALSAPVQEPLHDEKVRLIAHNECPEDWDSLGNKECWLKGFAIGFKTAQGSAKA